MDRISWHALEYKKTDKTVDWYWAVVIIALSMAVISFILGNGLFSIFIIIATFILVTLSSRDPEHFEVIVDKRGFTVGRDKYPFANIEDFWVDISENDSPKVLLKSKKLASPLIVIPIEEYNHLYVRDFLLQYLPEKEMHEPLSQKVMEKLGF